MDQKDENPVTHLDLRTPEEWGKVKGIRVIDPDGWRGEDGLSWETPITEEDYDGRAAVSSINMKTADHSPIYSEVVADHRTPAGYRAPRGDRRADTTAIKVVPHTDLGLVTDQQAYDYVASTISPEFARALAPNHEPRPNNGGLEEEPDAPIDFVDDGECTVPWCNDPSHDRQPDAEQLEAIGDVLDDEAATADTPDDRHEDRSEPLWSQAGYDSEGEWITAGRP